MSCELPGHGEDKVWPALPGCGEGEVWAALSVALPWLSCWMVSDVVNQLSLSNAAGWGAAAGFGAGATPARLCSGCFTLFPSVFSNPACISFYLLLSLSM